MILALVFLFLILGVVLKYLKWDWLIAGYNTMSKEQKQEVDIEGLRNFLSNSMFIMSAIFLVAFLFSYVGYNTSALVAFIMLIVYSIFMMFYVQRFYRNKKIQRKNIIIIIAILLITGALIRGVFLFGAGDTEISVDSQEIIISGMYGTTISLDELKEIRLIEQIPRIIVRTNGYSLGNTLKGNFKLEEYGKVKLFLVSDQGPFLLLRNQEDTYIINYKESTKTDALYKEICNK